MVAEPCMVAAIWRAFNSECKFGSWRKAALALAVCASVKPLRYAHALRSRPVARTSWWMAFWAYQSKVRTDGCLRGGFCWFVPLVTPTLRAAASVLWDTWLRVWEKTEGASQCMVVNCVTLEPVPARVFNRIIQDCFSDQLRRANCRSCASYSLRRYQPTLLDVRKAPLPERMALGGWVDQGARADAIMPLRYADTKAQAELEAGVVQGLFTATTLLTCRTWEDVRVWWHVNGAAQETQWRQRFHDLLQVADVTWAPGSDEREVTVQEPRFELTLSEGLPFAGQVGLQGAPDERMPSWITSQRKRALLHIEFEGRPRCTWKQAKQRASFKSERVVVRGLLEAVAMQRDFCRNCIPWLSPRLLQELRMLAPGMFKEQKESSLRKEGTFFFPGGKPGLQLQRFAVVKGLANCDGNLRQCTLFVFPFSAGVPSRVRNSFVRRFVFSGSRADAMASSNVLAIGGVPLPAVQEVSEEAATQTFTQLCTQFRIHPDVGVWLPAHPRGFFLLLDG